MVSRGLCRRRQRVLLARGPGFADPAQGQARSGADVTAGDSWEARVAAQGTGPNALILHAAGPTPSSERRPRSWEGPAQRASALDALEVGESILLGGAGGKGGVSGDEWGGMDSNRKKLDSVCPGLIPLGGKRQLM